MLTGPAWEWAEAATKALRRKYLNEGWYFAKLDKIEDGGAPMLIGADERVILMDDFLVHPKHGLSFADSKFKDHTDIFQKGTKKSLSTDGKYRHWQHGVDTHHFDHYRRLQDLTKLRGQLSLLVWRPGSNADPDPHHLWQWLDVLEKHAERAPPRRGAPHGITYFPMPAWKCGPIDFVAPPHLPRLRTKVNPWENKARDGSAPAWKIEHCDQSPFERYVCHCGATGRLWGYRREGGLTWYCEAHRLAHSYSNAYHDPLLPLFGSSTHSGDAR